MADQNDLTKPDQSSRYDTEVFQTLLGHITRLWRWDGSGMAGLVSGMVRGAFTAVSGGRALRLYRRNDANTAEEEVVYLPGVSVGGNAATATSATFASSAATSTKLATARNIGGVAFDGSADISLPGVNQPGDQPTTGNAATATAVRGPARSDVASASTINLTNSSDDIRITGSTTITQFTVQSGRVVRVTFSGALTLTNGASLVTQTGANITTQAGDTCMLRATAANVVEVLGYSSTGLWYVQSWQTFTVGTQRVVGTTYYNTTGKPIVVNPSAVDTGPGQSTVSVNGVVQNQFVFAAGSFNGSFSMPTIVPPGSSYVVGVLGSMSINQWTELR